MTIFFIHQADADVLNMGDQLTLKDDLSEEELLRAIKMSNKKSAPGLDRLSCEVYKVFWKHLKESLLACFNILN